MACSCSGLNRVRNTTWNWSAMPGWLSSRPRTAAKKLSGERCMNSVPV